MSMGRREFFRWLPVLPVALITTGPEAEAPRELQPGDVLTAEEWNRLVRAVRKSG